MENEITIEAGRTDGRLYTSYDALRNKRAKRRRCV